MGVKPILSLKDNDAKNLEAYHPFDHSLSGSSRDLTVEIPVSSGGLCEGPGFDQWIHL
jgi:hypothetical protein